MVEICFLSTSCHQGVFWGNCSGLGFLIAVQLLTSFNRRLDLNAVLLVPNKSLLVWALSTLHNTYSNWSLIIAFLILQLVTASASITPIFMLVICSGCTFYTSITTA